MGSPARVKRTLTEDEIKYLEGSREEYVEVGKTASRRWDTLRISKKWKVWNETWNKRCGKVAGVSPTTVSRVLNNRGYISEETRKKVYDAMEEINYYPNEIARALLNNRTYFVGVIVPTVTSPFHGEVVEQIEYYLSQKNYKMLLCNSKNQMDTEKAYIDMLRRNQVDGMIVGTHNAVVETYSKLKMPVVGIDRYLGEHIPVVSCDNYAAGQMATRHLIDKGCQHILCIRGNSKLKMPGNNRSQAYIQEMEKVGLPQMILEVPFIMENVEKQKLIYDMLNAHPEIDGIFAGDDSLAVIALHVAKAKRNQYSERSKDQSE